MACITMGSFMPDQCLAEARNLNRRFHHSQAILVKRQAPGYHGNQVAVDQEFRKNQEAGHG